MPAFKFPKLELNQWKDTRDSIRTVAKIMGLVRQSFTQKQKHWYHVNVRPSINGFSTTLLHQHHNHIFELEYNFHQHQLIVKDYSGNQYGIGINEKTESDFAQEVADAVKTICGEEPALDDATKNSNLVLMYNEEHAMNYYYAFLEISTVFNAFKHSFKEETSQVQLWPDHFDLALLWFSGRKVDGVDVNDEENADEQMNFGFSTGDESIPEAYIYITAYPLPDEMK
ncbi:MAG: hypothetical protein HKN75_11535, partial [Bacteroidia bacterium]|nr:hypothetical protein [Bacteroidia bacterium]